MTVKVEPQVHLCTLVMLRVLVLLPVYTPHSFYITLLTGHDYSGLSHARFNVTISHFSVLIWCFTEREDHAHVVMCGSIIHSGYCLFNCGVKHRAKFLSCTVSTIYLTCHLYGQAHSRESLECK